MATIRRVRVAPVAMHLTPPRERLGPNAEPFRPRATKM